MIQLKIKRPCHCVDIVIKTNSAKFSEQIKLFFQTFIDENTDDDLNDTAAITVQFKNDVACIDADNEKYNGITDNPMQKVVNFVYDNIKIEDDFFGMHAAAVAYRGNAYAFAASTGAGKTTLTSYLLNTGFDYITDDCVLINKNTLMVTPFCNTVHLRKGGLDILKKYNAEPQNIVKVSEGTVERYLYLPINRITEPVILKHIFFIERNEVKNETVTLPFSEIMPRLIKSAISPYIVSSGYLKFFSGLSRISGTFINYKDMDFIADYIKSGV